MLIRLIVKVESLHQTGILGHAVEGGILRLQQLGRRCKLHDLALVKHDHLVRVHDGVQTVSDRQHRTVLKLRANGALVGKVNQNKW